MGQRTPRTIAGFVQQVERTFKPTLVILFGSRARGNALRESDYDFLIVARVFEGVHPVKRSANVLRFHPGNVSIDVICLTPRELERERTMIGVVAEALREGKILGGSMKSTFSMIRRSDTDIRAGRIKRIRDLNDVLREIEG